MKIIKTIVTVIAFLAMLPFVASANDMQAYEKMIDGLDAAQAMAFANQWKWTQDEITSYVNSKEVVFEFPGNKIKRIPLPQDKMVVAVAPYINFTHGWATHYMSSCQGELANADLYVKAVGQDGKVLVDKVIQTMANGFFELWLPRNQNISLTIQGFNKKATGLLGTFANSNTCITTFRLM